jgi:hypothetical protein
MKKITTYCALLLVMLQVPARAQSTVFSVDENGARPRWYSLGIDTSVFNEECVSAYKSTLFSNKPWSKITLQGSALQTGIGLGVDDRAAARGQFRWVTWTYGTPPYPPNAQKKVYDLGDASDLSAIKPESGAWAQGVYYPSHGILSPSHQQVNVRYQKRPEYKGEMLTRQTVEKAIATTDALAAAGNAVAAKNAKLLRALRAFWANYDAKSVSRRP